MTIICKTCGNTIADSAEACPHCGADYNSNHPVVYTIKVILGIGLLAWAGWAVWKVFSIAHAIDKFFGWGQ